VKDTPDKVVYEQFMREKMKRNTTMRLAKHTYHEKDDGAPPPKQGKRKKK
jgi:hypothetical protein